jgi:hypothetical protein
MQDMWSVLSFKAFLPEAGDATLPLKARMTGRPIGGLYVGPTQISSCIMRYTAGGFLFSNITKRPIDFALRELQPEDFRSLFKENIQDLVVVVGGMTEVTLKSNIRRQPEIAELQMLSAQPQKIISTGYSPNHRYSLLHNATQNQSFLASTDLARLNMVSDVLRRAQFNIIRMQSALVGALDRILDEDEVKNGRAFPLILDHGNAFFTKVTQGVWEGWRYRAKVISSIEDSALKVFINSLALGPQDTILLIDLGSNYDYPIAKDLEGIAHRRYEVAAVGQEYLPFYLSTLN